METNNISKIIKRYLFDRFPEEASLTYWNELKPEITPDTYSALQRVNQRIGYAGKPAGAIPFYKKALRMAAILIPFIIVAGGYFYYSQHKITEITVAYGETRHLLLPDSSEIWINAGSTIKYPKTFSEEKRQIYLKGEAYFSVKKDLTKPFIVRTNQLSVKVLGTKFNVKAYPDDEIVTATLTSGKVEVSTSARKKQILRPNEQLTYNVNTSVLNIENISPAETDAWLNGQLLFINSSFKDIMQTLERHFNITIDNQTNIPLDKQYTVKFLKGESLNDILQVLQDVAGFSYQQQGTNILLK